MTSTAEATEKRIPTFSWLVRRAEALSRQDTDEYDNLCNSSTNNLLHGCEVQMSRHSTLEFHLYPIGIGKKYCTVRGRLINGEWYTTYETHFSTTQWRKGMEQFLPFTMSMKPTYEFGAPCMFHNADGTVAEYQANWTTRRRGKPGSWSSCGLLIRDRDGQFINWIHLRSAKAGAGSGGKYENIEFKSERENCDSLNPSTTLHQHQDLKAGFLPGSCTKKEWYDSMTPPAGRSHLWDEQQVKLLAARVHAEAIRLTKQSPDIKIVLYPARRVARDQLRKASSFTRFSGYRRQHAALEWVGDGAEFWLVPELFAYWLEKNKTNPTFPDTVCFVRVAIPPSGNATLAGDGTSVITQTKSEDFGNRPDVPSVRAFHCLKCLKPEYAKTRRISGAYSHHPKPWSEETDGCFVDFSKQTDLVMVNDLSDQEAARQRVKDGEFIGLKPEDAFSAIAERALLASLPLC